VGKTKEDVVGAHYLLMKRDRHKVILNCAAKGVREGI